MAETWIARHRRWIVFSLATAALVALAAPIDYHDRDFAGFWLGSRMLLEGKDPYDPGVWLPALRATAPHLASVAPAGTGYGYPLWTALLTLPFALPPFEVASRAWLGSQTFLALIGIGALLSARDLMHRPTDVALVVALLVTSQPASMLEEIANVQGFVLATVSGALALLISGRAMAAGVVLGALLLKPHLVVFFIPVILLASRQPVRVGIGMLVTGASLFAISVAILPRWIGEWATTISRVDAGVGARATAWALGPMLGVPGAVPAAVAVVAFAWWWTTGPATPSRYAAALAMSLFVAPYAGRYDMLVLFAAIAIAVAALRTAQPSARVVALTLVVVAASPLPWLLHIRVLSGVNEGIGSLIPLVVFIVVVLCDRLGRRGLAARAL